MKIKKVECDQFAGMNGREVNFSDGLNIILGDNESGKSSTVDLIYSLLFQDTKLSMNQGSDKEFFAKYFPKKVSGISGDVVDGVLVFETESGVYKLKKEWEKGEGNSRLTQPDGTSIKDIKKINEILTGELKHRAGVYNEIVFASQKRNQQAIESIMRALTAKGDGTRDDLTSTLTRASLETGGVSLEKVEKEIAAKINALSGRWDIAKNAPEGGIKYASYKNAWSKCAGDVVKKYYELDENKTLFTETENNEKAIEEEKARYQKLCDSKKSLSDEKDRFVKVKGMIEQKAALTSVIKEYTSQKNEQEEILEKWPVIIEEINTASSLKEKLAQANTRGLYEKLFILKGDFDNKKSVFDSLVEVTADDINSLRKLVNGRQNEENKLSGMNLVAKIKTYGDHNIEFRTATGELINIDSDSINISEAVSIAIPGVMEMQLMPQGIDMDAVNENISALSASINAIYEKYGVSSVEELQKKADDYKTAKAQSELANNMFDNALAGKRWEDIEAEANSIPADIDSEDDIKKQISDLCGREGIEAFIGRQQGTIDAYKNKYENTDKLSQNIESLAEKIETENGRMNEIEAIPEEYINISDADKYEDNLKKEIQRIDELIEKSNDNIREYERKLGEKTVDEYRDIIQKLEEEFEAKKKELAHWLNIQKIFNSLKEQTGGVSVADIENNFKDYLCLISDGRINLTSIDEKLSVQLSSGLNSLTYDILSDGTKDTVSLAFRLAMLEHLYPDGNGLAVFDDPFTDMDPKRVAQSCKLIKKFAEKNQVIFITCDEKYKAMLDGTVITF